MERNKLKEVLLVTSDEKSINYKWEDNASKLKGIQVVSKEYDLPALIEEKEINFIGYKEGREQVFVKDPFYDNYYIEITKAEDRIFKNKIRFYKRIALLLGAKGFTANAEFREENKLSIEANGSISHKVVEINTGLTKEQISKFNKVYKLNSTLKPLEDFDRQRGFEEAKDLVNKLNLHNEIDIVGLIENNDPSLQNREITQEVTLELSNELNDLLEMSFNINAMGGVFGLGANFKKTTESMKKIILDTKIVFE